MLPSSVAAIAAKHINATIKLIDELRQAARDLSLLRAFVVEREAIVRYELDHARQLQHLRPDRYTAYLAHQLSQYSCEFEQCGQLDKAREAASEAVDLTHGLHDRDSVKYAAILADRLSGYGRLLDTSEFYSQACDVRSELVELTRVLVPTKCKRNAALRLQHCWAFILRFVSARISYEVRSASIKMIYELHILSPTQYLITLAARLQDYSDSLFFSGYIGKAGEIGAECLKYTRDLQKLNPGKYVADIASWRKERDVFLMRHTSTISQTPTRGLPSFDTLTYIQLLSRRLANHAICLTEAGLPSQALEIEHEAVEWSRELHRVDPDKYAADLAFRLNNYGHSLHSAESYSAACEAKSELVEITRELFASIPTNMLPTSPNGSTTTVSPSTT